MKFAGIILIIVLSYSPFYWSQIIDDQFAHKPNLSSESLTPVYNNQDMINYNIPPYIKSDFRINKIEGEYGAGQYRIRCASDEEGYTLFIWNDERNSEREIYGQFYDPLNGKIGKNFYIGKGSNYNVDADSKSGFIIVWGDYSLRAQRFDRYGLKIDGEIVVTTNFSSYPGVCINDDGSFVAVWAGTDNKLAGAFVDSTGRVVRNINVGGTNRISSFGLDKRISSDSSGNYYVCWSSRGTTGVSNIFMQKLNSKGLLIGDNLIISENVNSMSHHSPSISTFGDGTSLICWSSQNLILGRIVNADGSFQSGTFRIDNDEWWDSFDITTYNDSAFLVLRSGYNQPQFQIVTRSGELFGDTVSVNFNRSYFHGEIVRKNKNFLFGYEGNDKNDVNIYFDEFDTLLTPVLSNIKVNDDSCSSDQQFPVVKSNRMGESLVLWTDARNGQRDLYAQLYNAQFIPIGENIKINDESGELFLLNNKTAVTLSDGSYVVVFSSTGSLFAQKISRTGRKIGNNMQVGRYYYFADDLTANANNNDEIEIAWFGERSIYVSRIDKNLNILLSERDILKLNYQVLSSAAIAIDTSLNILFVSRIYDLTLQKHDKYIYGTIYNKNGAVLRPKFLVDSVTSQFNIDLECKLNGSDYVIINESVSQYQVTREYGSAEKRKVSMISSGRYPLAVEVSNQKLFLIYHIGYDQIGGIYFNDEADTVEYYNLHSLSGSLKEYDDDGGGYRRSITADLRREKLFFVYQDLTEPGRGIDIAANVRHLEGAKFERQIIITEPPIKEKFTYELYNNYPNPFNNSTIIRYSLELRSRATLKIYNVLGQLIQTLVNQFQDAGEYEVPFNSDALSSGAYFYMLEAESEDGTKILRTTKKMLLLK